MDTTSPTKATVGREPRPANTLTPDVYVTPRKVTKIAQLIATPPTDTSNRYEPLNQLPDTETEIKGKTQGTTKPRTPPKSPKERSCPPIVIQGTVKNHKDLTEELKKHIKKGFYIKYARKTVLLYIKDNIEYNTYKQKLIETNEMQFHTYTTAENKTHAFVLRGLHEIPDVEEIKNELIEEYDIEVKCIYRMKTKFNPLYLVITDKSTALKQLQNKVKHLMYTKVTWERRANERLITQCRRCQAWGHATSNCFRAPRCVKCAEPHFTKNCEKPLTEPPKCVNCSGQHTACNPECPVYQYKVQKLQREEENEVPQKQRFLPAPAPETNVWDERRRTKQQLVPSTSAGPVVERNPPTESHQRNVPVSVSQPAESKENTCDTLSDFNELNRAFERLNSLVNLKETIKAVTILNNMLEKSKNALDTIMIMQEFTKNILPQYNVQNSTY